MRCPVCHSELPPQTRPGTRCPTCNRPLTSVAARGQTILAAEGVTKRYGSGHTEVVALSDVNLEVRQGEILLIMGPSGSGKTTLLLLLGCLMRPSDGTIRFYGDDVTTLSAQELATVRLLQLGFVFQDSNLMDSLTALENVEVPLHLARVRPANRRQRAEALLTDLGVARQINHVPGDMSGGEQQRVSIARAMALGPSLILADEPTAKLDSKNGLAAMEAFRRLAHEEGCAIVLVSHDIRLRGICDRLIQLDDGRIVAEEVAQPPRPAREAATPEDPLTVPLVASPGYGNGGDGAVHDDALSTRNPGSAS